MGQIKCDLHYHMDNHINIGDVKRILTLAQDNNVKVISLIEYDNYNLYKPNGVLNVLQSSGELNKIYSGKIVAGCEIKCVANCIPAKKGDFNFNNYTIHILLYDFNVEKMGSFKFFDNNLKIKNFKKDVKNFLKTLKKIKLELPSKKYFKENLNIFEQFYCFINENENRKLEFQKVLGSFNNFSAFKKELFENPNSKLFFKPSYVPYLTDVMEFARKIDAKIYIAHPCYTNSGFSVNEYLDALMNIKTDFAFPFDGIEITHYLNSVNDTKLLHDYAVSHNLEEIGGTDYKCLFSEQNPNGNMSLVNNNGQQIFTPKPGFLIKQFYETGNGELLIDEKFVNKLKDFRYKFEEF